MPKGHVLTTSQRGYGWQHQVMRRRIARLVDSGRAYCSRCGRPIAVGAAWHLDHFDSDRTRYKGPSHARCNERAARGLPVLAPQRPARALAFFDI
jgi:hypothetical protein